MCIRDRYRGIAVPAGIMFYFAIVGTDPGRQKATLRDIDKCPTVQAAGGGCQCNAHHHQHLPNQVSIPIPDIHGQTIRMKFWKFCILFRLAIHLRPKLGIKIDGSGLAASIRIYLRRNARTAWLLLLQRKYPTPGSRPCLQNHPQVWDRSRNLFFAEA